MTENGKPKEEQKFEFVDLLTEWLKYSVFTISVEQFNEENKFDIRKWLWANTTTIIIPIWLVTFIIQKFIIGQLGIVLGLAVLISPPLLMWFTLKLKLKGKNTYAFLLSLVHILIIWVVIDLFWKLLLYWSS